MNLLTPIGESGRSLKLYKSRLEKLNIFTFQDLLYHIPFRYDNFSLISKVGNVQPGEVVTIQGRVEEMQNVYTRSAKKIQKAVLSDETGMIDVTWFNQPFLTKYIHRGDMLSVSGKADLFGGKLSIQSPEYEMLTSSKTTLHTGRLVPIYSETKGLTSKWLRRQIHTVLMDIENSLEDYLPSEVIQREQLMDLTNAVKKIHFPLTLEEAEEAKRRLAFDELLLLQLRSIKRRRDWEEETQGTAFEIAKFEKEISTFLKSLPFTLTAAQERAVEDITKDLKQNKPMNRLLQGDVGSGKTIVAAVASYLAYLNGFQSAFLAPTEILAQQHYQTLTTFLSPFGITVDLRTGSSKGKGERGKGKEKSGTLTPSPLPLTPNILVGTHAILSQHVQFENLGLVIIDEQQRFGVKQRGIIRSKGNNPHILTMTATPIPRTVALTMYGDLDLSYLSEMPKGRKLIKTWLVPNEKRLGAYSWIEKEIRTNKTQAFIICPFIEDSENMVTVKAAKSEFERLQKHVFPDLKMSLLHGKLKAKEKEAILTAFKEKKADILVATPVVEVGIDIPNASIILIEAAERFGLAQLHQLRGRVGRGAAQSYCLLFSESTSQTTLQRLKAMETAHVGAELAELDLKLRGPGDIFGTAQHGLPKLKVATFSDFTLINKAKAEAEQIFATLHTHPRIKAKIEEENAEDISPD